MSLVRKSCYLLTLLTLFTGCGNKSKSAECAEKPAYEPEAAEIPLATDFERAAEQRVTADNYREQLRRIERELKLAARAR